MRSIVVDGVEIPEALIAQEVQNHPSASAADARAAASHALALKALLLARAQQIGLTATPERDEDGREETPEEALIRAVLEQELDVAEPTEQECRRVYESQPARFRTPPLYEASHILIGSTPDEAEMAATRAQALDLILKLQTGSCGFGELAAGHSDCPSAGVGGSLGQLAPGDLVPEVEDVLVALSPGEIGAEPVLSRFGWHVLRLDRHIEGRQLPFEFVADRIRLHLQSRAWAAAAARYAAELTAEAREKGVALTLDEEGRVREGSATLGDLLSDVSGVSRLGPWLVATDPELSERLGAAAEAAGEPVEEFVAAAMAEFVQSANDERWTNLISAARDAEDPALACLASVLRSKVAPAKRTFTLIRRT